MTSSESCDAGSNQHLKDKFGQGYSLDIRCDQEAKGQIQNWIQQIFPVAGTELTENLGTQLKYQIPTAGLPLSQAWASVEEGKVAQGINEYAISQTSLEQGTSYHTPINSY